MSHWIYFLDIQTYREGNEIIIARYLEDIFRTAYSDYELQTTEF